MKGDTVEPFMSPPIEMKFDQVAEFARQQHSHERRDVPSMDVLLEFVNWWAQASELPASCNNERKYSTMEKTKAPTSCQATME